MKNRPVQIIVVPALLLALIVHFSSCGTLIHPERRGQTGGRVDPSIAILDGIGLLFFIVPGLIAYAIDFSTGAIYLPGSSSDAGGGGESEADFVIVQASPEKLTNENVEAILKEHTGREVNLSDASIQAIPLDDPEEISSEYNKLVAAGVIPRM